MNPTLFERQAALAGVALLAAVGAIALGRDDAPAPTAPAPQARTLWHRARAGIAAATAASGCPAPLEKRTVGVVHPVLPCGAKLVVEANGRSLRVAVVGREAVGAHHAFDLTEALARRLGVRREAVVRWRFAK